MTALKPLLERLPTPVLQLLTTMPGRTARLLAQLPAPVQTRLAHTLGYRHAYAGLDPHLRLLLAIRQHQGSSVLLTDNVQQSRQHLRQEMAMIAGKPVIVGRVHDFDIDGPAGKIRLRHYQPQSQPPVSSQRPSSSRQATATASSMPLLVFYHGGGFMVGDLDTHDQACRLLCKYGNMQVLGVDYRLAPEHPAPAAVEDSLAAFDWAAAHARDLGADPARIAVGGDSAGGNLAAVVSQQRKHANPVPAAQLLIYPGVDLLGEYPSRTTFSEGLFLSEGEVQQAISMYVATSKLTLQDPLVTPALGDMQQLPPALVVTAGFDVLCDEGEAYARRMQQQGNLVILQRVADQGHGFINITPINYRARQATIKMAQDFRQLLDNIAAPA